VIKERLFLKKLEAAWVRAFISMAGVKGLLWIVLGSYGKLWQRVTCMFRRMLLIQKELASGFGCIWMRVRAWTRSPSIECVREACCCFGSRTLNIRSTWGCGLEKTLSTHTLKRMAWLHRRLATTGIVVHLPRLICAQRRSLPTRWRTY
jgi:hypothetical protein